MHPVIILAAVAASVSAPPVDTGGASKTAAFVGQWRLSEIGGKVGCTVSLSDAPAGQSNLLQVPGACARAFPPLKDLNAWEVNGSGDISFSGGPDHQSVVFKGPAGGPYEARAPDGSAWRLEPAKKP